jgi:hypothetical protein
MIASILVIMPPVESGFAAELEWSSLRTSAPQG